MLTFQRIDLLLYFLILALISEFLSLILKPLWLLLHRPSPEETITRAEMRVLRTEQDSISMKENFSAHAKLQRKLNKLEDELKLTVQSRLEKSMKLKYIITYGLHAALTLLIIYSTIYYRKEPLLTFEQNLFPFGFIFSYPGGVPQTLVAPAWMIVSRVSTSTVVRSISKINSYTAKVIGIVN